MFREVGSARPEPGQPKVGDDSGKVDVRLLGHKTDVLSDFEDYLLSELGRSPKTSRAYVQQLTAVAEQLGKPIVKVSIKDLRYDVKRDDTVARSTRQLRLAAFKQLHLWGLVEELPWASTAILGVRSLKESQRMPKPPLSPHEARRILDLAQSPNEVRLCYFGLYAGCRVSESAAMSADNVVGDCLVFVGKGDKERKVPIHPRLQRVLGHAFASTPASTGVLESSFARLRDRYDVRDLKGIKATTHTLRRTFADHLYSTHGVAREVVQALLGHGGDVTDLYAPVRVPALVEAVALIDYTRGEPHQLTLF